MNNNQLTILKNFSEKNDWESYVNFLKNEFDHLNFEEKLSVIMQINEALNNAKFSLKKNAIKWAMSAIAQTWTIEKNKNPKFDEIVEAHIEKFLPEQLISLSEYYISEKKLEKAYNCIGKLWAFSPCIKIDQEFLKIVSIIKEMNDPEQTAHLIYLAIDIGNQKIAKEAYQIFYNQYFDKFDLEDEKIYLWENLWKKINNNPDNWLLWELLKLDIGLITDIIIKKKTNLQIPLHRKKREVAKTIVFLNEWQSLGSTLLKYFHEMGNKEMVLNWIKFCEEKKIYPDMDSQLIIKSYKLEKPKVKPLITKTHDEQENITQIISEEEIDELANYTLIKNKLNQIIPHHEEIEDVSKNLGKILNWEEKIEVFSLQKNYKAVLNLIRENKENIMSHQKMDYEIFEMETMLKLGLYLEVLEMLDGLWKNVQELEIFKVLKYIEGECLWMLNRKREASDCFRKVVDIDPSYKLAKWRLIENSL